MIILVENRSDVAHAFASALGREQTPVAAFCFEDAADWFTGTSNEDLRALTGVLIGSGGDLGTLTRLIRNRSTVPVIAMTERRSLAETLAMFTCGVDDVVAKPVHAKELVTRIRIIAARKAPQIASAAPRDIVVFLDGRDPLVAGEPLRLPRRERRILDCLAASRGAWISKNQIFGQVYGLFNDDIDDYVVESHISRLRKRLKMRLGRDAIESQRFLGYRMVVEKDQSGTANSRRDSIYPEFCDTV